MQAGSVYSGTLKLDRNLILMEWSNDLCTTQTLKIEENIKLIAAVVLGFM